MINTNFIFKSSDDLNSPTPFKVYSTTSEKNILKQIDQSSKLNTRYRYENQFWNPGFMNGLVSFVNINIL